MCHATLIIDQAFDPPEYFGVTWWDEAQAFVGRFTAATPQLFMLRFAVQHQDLLELERDSMSHRDFLDGRMPEHIAKKSALLSTPPPSIAGFSLRQRGEGYHLCNNYSYPIAAAMLDPYVGADLIPGRNVVAYHEVIRVGAYSYGREKSAKGYWEVYEVIDELVTGADSPEAFDPQTEEERAMLSRLPYEMRDWKERRDHEVMKWNG